MTLFNKTLNCKCSNLYFVPLHTLNTKNKWPLMSLSPPQSLSLLSPRSLLPSLSLSLDSDLLLGDLLRLPDLDLDLTIKVCNTLVGKHFLESHSLPWPRPAPLTPLTHLTPLTPAPSLPLPISTSTPHRFAHLNLGENFFKNNLVYIDYFPSNPPLVWGIWKRGEYCTGSALVVHGQYWLVAK